MRSTVLLHPVLNAPRLSIADSMTAVALSGGASGGGLAEALEALSEDLLDTEEQLQARLIAIQEVRTLAVGLPGWQQAAPASGCRRLASGVLRTSAIRSIGL